MVTAAPFLWLLIFFFVPFLIVLKVSLAEAVLGNPPFTDLLSWRDDGVVQLLLNLDNYRLMVVDSLYFGAFVNSLKVAAVATALCLVLGYPMAYGIALAPERWRMPLLMLIILPFWTSFLIRVYAWIPTASSTTCCWRPV